MNVSRSGYYSWRNRSQSTRDQEREQLISKVKAIRKKSRSTYGKRRIAEELQSEGISCGEHKAGTLMKLAGVQAKQKKKCKATTNSKHNLPVSQNLLKREFDVSHRCYPYGNLETETSTRINISFRQGKSVLQSCFSGIVKNPWHTIKYESKR
jgi:transposase InsO family protein